MIILLSLLVCLIGLLMYALSANPKLNAIGFAMFEVGLLAFLLQDAALLTLIR
jgi:Na+/phosphate symporter